MSEQRPRPDDRSPTACAEELLAAVRAGEDPRPYLDALEGYDEADLKPLREDRRTALAFWLNCYNAGTQLLLDREPGLYRSALRTVRFFRATAVRVAGTPLGLDDIEHGILRGKSKYGLGYLPRVFSGSFERRYRLPEPDPRIHFALNCGAVSCPAVRAYEPDAVDEQLDLATETYLDGAVEYDPDAGTVEVPRLMLWYRGDFGGRSGVLAMLREYGAIPADAAPDVGYAPWDWSLAPGKFAGD